MPKLAKIAENCDHNIDPGLVAEIHRAIFKQKCLKMTTAACRVSLLRRARSTAPHNQGFQIVLGTKYQNGKMYTKLPRTIPKVHKI
jgi:hypothetical protein